MRLRFAAVACSSDAHRRVRLDLGSRDLCELALVEHRSDEEHRGYWLTLDPHAGKNHGAGAPESVEGVAA